MFSKSEMRSLDDNPLPSNNSNHKRLLFSTIQNWYINYSRLTKKPIYLKVSVIFKFPPGRRTREH